MMQVHKSVLGKVPDSIKGRDNPKVGHSINGMSYIPHEALQERALNTGVNLSNNNTNNHSNNNNNHGSKRPKYNPMQHACFNIALSVRLVPIVHCSNETTMEMCELSVGRDTCVSW